MGQAGSNSGLKRMAIIDPNKKKSFKFAVNPQEYEVVRPQRVSVVRTLTDIVIEDFNGDVPVLTISGHTGWNQGSGKTRFDALESLLLGYANETMNFGNLKQEPLLFMNYTDERYYRVHIHSEGYKFARSVENPLLYNYSMTFFIVSDTATYKNPAEGVIGKTEVTTGDTNTDSRGDVVKSSQTNKTAKPKPKAKVAPTSTARPINDNGVVVIASTGYSGAQLANTELGSIRLANTIGVV